MKKLAFIIMFLAISYICYADAPVELDLSSADTGVGNVFNDNPDSWGPSLVFDHTSGTRFAGTGPTNWIWVDLGEVKSISSIVIDFEQTYARDFQILTRINAPGSTFDISEWKVAAVIEDLGEAGDGASMFPEYTNDAVINFDQGTITSDTASSIGPSSIGNAAGRYLCIYMTESNKWNLFSIFNLNVYARSAANFAELVSPADGAEDLPLSTTLEWTPGSDPNITGYYVYLGTDIGELTLENSTALPPDTTTYQLSSLQQDTRYYWRVEEKVASNPAGDPNNNYKGHTWSFTTRQLLARVYEQPENTAVLVGEDANLRVFAYAPGGGGVSYQWYYDSDGIEGGETALTDGADYQGVQSPELTILDADIDDSGYYFCALTNENGTLESNMARVNAGTKELLAHWTFDSADTTGDDYLDISGNSVDAVLEAGTPEFPDGIVDGDGEPNNTVDSGAVGIDEDGGWAQAGTFEPSGQTGSFSISTWIYPIDVDSTPLRLYTIASKCDGFTGTSDNKWVLMYNGDDHYVNFSRWGDSFGVGDVNEGEWTHIVATYHHKEGGKLYVNGDMAASSSSFRINPAEDVTFRIGSNNYSGQRFKGRIDDMKVYSYALSYSEIMDIYSAETNETRCVLQSPFNTDDDCAVTFADMISFGDEWLSNGWYPYTPSE